MSGSLLESRGGVLGMSVLESSTRNHRTLLSQDYSSDTLQPPPLPTFALLCLAWWRFWGSRPGPHGAWFVISLAAASLPRLST